MTKEKVGTRYVRLAVRTFVNPNDAADIRAVHALQDAIEIEQKSAGTFEVPNCSAPTGRTGLRPSRP